MKTAILPSALNGLNEAFTRLLNRAANSAAPYLSTHVISRAKRLLKVLALLMILLLSGAGVMATNYYTYTDGNPYDVNKWWTGTNGTGTHPDGFRNPGDVFIIQNNNTMTATYSWAVSNLTINTGATLNFTGSMVLLLEGNFTNHGTLSATIILLSGSANQSIDGFATYGRISMAKNGGIATFQGNVNANILEISETGGTLNLGTGLTHNFSGTWNNTNGTLNGGSSILRIEGNVVNNGGVFTAGTGTVEWSGYNNQTIAAVTYNNLILSGSGIKTPMGNTNVGGILTVKAGTTLAGTYTLGASTPPTSVVLECGASAGSVIYYTGTLYLGGNVTVNNAGTGNNGATIFCPVALGAPRMFNVANDGTSATDLTVSGVISGASIPLAKVGEGKLTLTANNTFSGGLNISAGTVELGAADVIATQMITLNGETFSTGATAGYNETVGILALTNNSTIHLGTGNHSLHFDASTGVGWTAGKILSITGWAGTPGSSGTAGKIYFGASTGNLTAAQLSQISFEGYPGTPILLSTGELVPYVVTPVITVGSISNFGNQCINTASDIQSYMVSGSLLTGAIEITPPPGFEISLPGVSFDPVPYIRLNPGSNGSIPDQTIYVRFKPASAQVYSANITHTSTGATTVYVAVTGYGMDGSPTLGGASLAASYVCSGTGASVNLAGLLPSKTFTLEYSIDGVGQTPVAGLTSNASGNASFTTRNLTSTDHLKTLLITGMTDNETSCSQAFTTNLTLSVAVMPTATLDNLTTTICHGETVTLTGSVTATGNWSLSITGGGGVSILGSGSGTFAKTITPPILTTTYSIMAISDHNYTCTSFTGFTGQAVVTADQKPILSVHNPAAVSAPNTVDLTAPAVTSGSSLPSETVLTYWKGEVQLTTEQAKAISVSGTYTIKATRLSCDVSTNVTVEIIYPAPSITLGANPMVCLGVTSADLIYTATTNVPDQYNLDWNATAETAGFVDVSYTSLPSSPITLTVPVSASAGTYSGVLKVKNTSNGSESDSYAIQVTINPEPTLGGASLAAAYICSGTEALVNLTGLLPSKTFTLQYSIDGVGQTPVAGLTSNASGNASFTTRNLTSADNLKTLQITGLTDGTGCSQAFSTNITLSVPPLPTATLDNLTTTICHGETVTLTGSVTATGDWSLSITGGGGFSVSGSGSGTFEKTITPPILTTTYSITGIVDIDHQCIFFGDYPGQAVVTADQKPILSVHNPAAVSAPNTVDLTAPAVTSGSSLPSETVLTYWKGEVQLTTEQAKAISVSGTYTIKATRLSCDVSANVTVEIINVAPELAAIGNKTVDELATLSFTATATDGDLPANSLTFSLANPASGTYPTGAIITTVGDFSWIPAEAQGPGTYRVKVVVSDGTATDEEEIQMIVNEVNFAPELTGVPTEATIDEEVTYGFDTDASDVDVPAQTLTFSLIGAPAGASIDGTTGVFAWNPAEDQGPDDYTFTVRVSDGVVNTNQIITLHVSEVNIAPELAAIGNKTVDELATLSFTASATDGDLPANSLTFSLVNPASGTYPTGAGITTGGDFSWTPTEAQGPGTYRVKVVVSDGTATDEEEIQVTVKEVNIAPELAAIGNKTVDELTTLSFTASATDGDLPANTLTFSLANPASGTYPTGAIITTGGDFSWTPTEAQGPGTYRVKVVASDGIVTDDEEIQIIVNEVNIAPELTGVPTEKTNPWGNLLTFIATASDQDVPENKLTFSLIGAPIGASIVPETGVFEWTPAETQNNQSYTFKIRVTDNGINPDNLYDEEEITVTVVKRITSLVYGGDMSEQYSDETNLSATLYDITNGVPGTVISGKPIDFTIESQSTDPDPTTNGSGVASATLILTESPVPSYKVVSTFAGDASYELGSDEDDFNITQENALVDYIGTNIVGEANPDVNTTQVNLVATITDIADGYRGDVRYARVRFMNGSSPIPGCDWLTPTLVNPSDLTQGIVSFIWDAPVPTVGYTTYEIGIQVGTQTPAEADGYYKGYELTTLNVYRTSLNEFITGGGHIIPVDSKGEYASDPGRKTNFGFNVKWNKTMKNLQGNFNLILRRGSEIYQIKSNALSSLGIDGSNPCSHKAVLTAKANLNRVTGGISENIMGNLSLQLTLTDNGEPGVTDMMGVTLYNGSTLLYSSSWPISSTEELALVGGNILVHDGLICNASDITHTVITSSKNPSLTNEDVTFTATVYGHDATPQGTLEFTINGETFDGTLDSKGSTFIEYSFDEASTYEVEANYNSTNGYKPSTGSITQLVNGTSFILSSSKNPSVFGDEVTFTAVLTKPDAAPTGTVTFKVDGEEKAIDELIADKKATFTTNLLSSGSHTIEAVYTSTNDPLIVVDPATLTQVVNNVSISLASSKNPSALTESVSFTATVTGRSSVGKTVNFIIGENTLSGIVDVSGNAIVIASFSASGTYAATATLADPVISTSLNQVVTESSNITVLLTSTVPTGSSITYGTNVTFTAMVNGSSATPYGTITFKDGTKILKVVTVSGGKASFSTNKLVVGLHSITATYDLTKTVSKETILLTVLAKTKSAEIATANKPTATYESTFRAYPNPFTEKLKIEFSSATDTQVKLEIYNVVGSKLETLFNGPIIGGELYTVEYLPKLVSSQIVLYHLTINGQTQVGKLIYNERR